jgi:SMC interacting uncharacterized protein involved in chromosome segregation
MTQFLASDILAKNEEMKQLLTQFDQLGLRRASLQQTLEAERAKADERLKSYADAFAAADKEFTSVRTQLMAKMQEIEKIYTEVLGRAQSGGTGDIVTTAPQSANDAPKDDVSVQDNNSVNDQALQSASVVVSPLTPKM